MARDATLWDELVAAGRGVVALITGDRAASRHFDLTQRGLVGSFIAVLAIAAFGIYLPIMLGIPGAAGTALISATFIALVTAINAGISALTLRQLNRLDGFIPYLVADNWASFYVTVGSLILRIGGLDGAVLFFASFLLSLLIAVNIARLVVTLSPRQVAIFVGAQVVSFCIGQLLEAALFAPIAAESVTASSLPG